MNFDSLYPKILTINGKLLDGAFVLTNPVEARFIVLQRNVGHSLMAIGEVDLLGINSN